MGDINKIEEECTHNCMTCGHETLQKAVMVWENSKKP